MRNLILQSYCLSLELANVLFFESHLIKANKRSQVYIREDEICINNGNEEILAPLAYIFDIKDSI
jgi:hypothetical protein